MTLAKKGFYDGLTFHRVEPGFVVQGGRSQGQRHRRPGLHDQGRVQQAEARPRRGGDGPHPGPRLGGQPVLHQLAPAHFLDNKYTVFGQVTSGMDVVDKIKVGDKMKSVKIIEAAQ